MIWPGTRFGKAMPQVAATPPFSTNELRWQLAAVVVAVAILSIAVGGLALYLMRRKREDRGLIYFSMFALLYGARLLIAQRFVVSLAPFTPGFWRTMDFAIDCAIVVPLTLFLIENVDTQWKRILRWVLAFQITFEGSRFILEMLGVKREPIELAHSVAILGYCLLIAAYPFARPRGQPFSREWKIVYTGLAIFGAFVVHNNLADLGLMPGRNLEPLGFLIFVCCLGYFAAYRSFRNEERLIAINKELEIAQQIQGSLLPRELPKVSRMNVAARYVPMAAVAGDFYDFLVLDEQRFGVLVADVTGHGVPAALIASMLKATFAAQLAHAAQPAEVLARLNHSLCGKFESHFVTAAYLFVDLELGILRYAGAGHPPMVFAHAGDFERVESNGLILGIVDGAEYRSVEREFRPGDRCVLYTDGVIEANDAAGEEFGAERFGEFWRGHANVSADRVIEEFLTELRRWTGRTNSGWEDDITLVVVERKLNGLAGGGKSW